MTEDKCNLCGNAVVEGEAIYGYTGDHWDCTYPDGVGPTTRLDKAIEDMDAALERFKSFVDARYK